mmetsp:Transcript_2576/g.6217  ORF Transcript_2576/g.6217 Transcript_2576/m.6217 type:complete len:605 (-) Transcript_2576:274-2088(-)
MAVDGGDESELYPIAILIDELKNEDIQLRLNSIRRLSTIAVALGAERTRCELVPFLNDSIDDEDEVLLAMAEELGKFVAHVGGAQHAACLIPPLETLCTIEEASVRERAVASFNEVAAALSADHLLTHFVPLVKRLATADWFTSRISACSLFTVAYPRVPPATRSELRATFKVLCRDDTPMVRRAASSALGGFAGVLERELLKTEVMPLFVALASDEQDSVRLLAVENCVALGRLLPPEDAQAAVLPATRSAASDKSWRVRYVVAEQFVVLCDALGPQVTHSELVPAFVKLLRDNEPEVRTAAAFQVTGVCERLTGVSESQGGEGVSGPELQVVLSQLLPCVQELCADASQHVRAAIASVIMGLAPVLGKAHTISSLLPLVLVLLRDEYPEVRLNVIARLHAVNSVIGVELLAQSLLPAVVQLAEDRQWRVRLAIIEYVPLLAQQLGVELFDAELSKLCTAWLADCVSTIREVAIANLKKLIAVFGVEWAQQRLLPEVASARPGSAYHKRMTALLTARLLAETLPAEVLASSLLPLTLELAKDPVPNIRFNAAKTLGALVPALVRGGQAAAVQSRVKPALTALLGDPDTDVQFYATQALELVQN